MTLYKYKDIVANARKIKGQVESDYDFTLTPNWVYYISKEILKAKRDINGFGIAKPSKPAGDTISRQINQENYIDMSRRIVKYVEEKKQIPNYVTYKGIKVNIRLWTYISSYLLVHYADEGKWKSAVNVNSKYMIKPTDTPDAVYNSFIKTFGKVTTFTDALRKIWNKGYGFYFDNYLTNLQVIHNLAYGGQKPNCVDVCQMMWHIAKGLGYDVRCLHVYCPVDDITHVRLQVKHSKWTGGAWEDYDPAAVIDGEDLNSLWCSGSGSYVIAINPSWFIENLNK